MSLEHLQTRVFVLRLLGLGVLGLGMFGFGFVVLNCLSNSPLSSTQTPAGDGTWLMFSHQAFDDV